MTASALELAGMLIACGAAAAALLLPEARHRHLAMGVALLAAPVLVAGDVWDQPRFEELRDSPPLVAAAAGGVLAIVAAGSAIFLRYPVAFPIAAFSVLPIRIPFELGGETSNLLIPLYGVIASAVLARLWRTFAPALLPRPGNRLFGRVLSMGAPRRAQAVAAHGGGNAKQDPPAARLVLWALAATLVLYAIQTAYSKDVSNAIENAGFFLVPFAVLLALLLELRWTSRLLGLVLVSVGVVALVYGAIAIWQYAVRDLFLNQQLSDSNQLHLYFRVNSIFKDPNVLGRNLALVAVALATWVAWQRDDRRALWVTGAAMLLVAALAFSFSVTSAASLLAGLVTVAWFRWGSRAGLAAATACALCAVLTIVLAADEGSFGSERRLDETTSGRAGLIEGGIELAEKRPVAGWGSGSFGAAFVREIEPAETIVSHAEPVTVAAEQGAIGVAVYAGLLVVSLIVLLGRAVGASLGRTAVAACFVAMLVHSLGYGSFLIDPATWAVLGLGVALASEELPARRPTAA